MGMPENGPCGAEPPAAEPSDAEMPPNMTAEDAAVLKEHVATRRLISAIKLVREVTGWPLIEAKRFVDKLRDAQEAELSAAKRSAAEPSDAEMPPNMTAEDMAVVKEHVAARTLIPAIRLVRQVTGWPLRESKQFVDKLRDEQQARTSNVEMLQGRFKALNEAIDILADLGVYDPKLGLRLDLVLCGLRSLLAETAREWRNAQVLMEIAAAEAAEAGPGMGSTAP